MNPVVFKKRCHSHASCRRAAVSGQRAVGTLHLGQSVRDSDSIIIIIIIIIVIMTRTTTATIIIIIIPTLVRFLFDKIRPVILSLICIRLQQRCVISLLGCRQ